MELARAKSLSLLIFLIQIEVHKIRKLFWQNNTTFMYGDVLRS